MPQAVDLRTAPLRRDRIHNNSKARSNNRLLFRRAAGSQKSELWPHSMEVTTLITAWTRSHRMSCLLSSLKPIASMLRSATISTSRIYTESQLRQLEVACQSHRIIFSSNLTNSKVSNNNKILQVQSSSNDSRRELTLKSASSARSRLRCSSKQEEAGQPIRVSWPVPLPKRTSQPLSIALRILTIMPVTRLLPQ